jgi:hypothetical protein
MHYCRYCYFFWEVKFYIWITTVCMCYERTGSKWSWDNLSFLVVWDIKRKCVIIKQLNLLTKCCTLLLISQVYLHTSRVAEFLENTAIVESETTVTFCCSGSVNLIYIELEYKIMKSLHCNLCRGYILSGTVRHNYYCPVKTFM